MADFSIEELIECASREVGMREYVFPRRVADGKMKQAKADSEIAKMKAIVAELQKLAPRLV